MNWDELKQELGEHLYQPIEHPDFKGFDVAQTCTERLRWIWENLPRQTRGGTMLDIGSHTGFFCRQFSRLGWQAIGVERSQVWYEVAMEMQHFLKEPRPIYMCGDVFDMILPPAADVVLCLSVAMYLFDDVAKGWELFQKLSEIAPQMFFDFGGMYAHRAPFTEANVGEQMLKHTAFKSFYPIGASSLGRTLFVFER